MRLIALLLLSACTTAPTFPEPDWRCQPMTVCVNGDYQRCDDAAAICGCPARWPVWDGDCLACTDGVAVELPAGVSECLTLPKAANPWT
jgi:hypothetical protein